MRLARNVTGWSSVLPYQAELSKIAAGHPVAQDRLQRGLQQNGLFQDSGWGNVNGSDAATSFANGRALPAFFQGAQNWNDLLIHMLKQGLGQNRNQGSNGGQRGRNLGNLGSGLGSLGQQSGQPSANGGLQRARWSPRRNRVSRMDRADRADQSNRTRRRSINTGRAERTAAPNSSAPGSTQSGQKLARSAARVARRMNRTGLCYRGVKAAVRNATGVQLTGGSAYQAANQLARSDKFKEVKVSQANLKKLPPGAVVVWGKTKRSPHGHISVALGDGREASDHIQRQITSLRGARNYRVFVPK